jgi:hypothetical protein
VADGGVRASYVPDGPGASHPVSVRFGRLYPTMFDFLDAFALTEWLVVFLVAAAIIVVAGTALALSLIHI